MKRPEVLPFERQEVLTLAARGVGKVDLWGKRGATLVTAEEVEAMACALALLGVTPIEPGTYSNANHVTHTEGERA